jgi:hypothetical protein
LQWRFVRARGWIFRSRLGFAGKRGRHPARGHTFGAVFGLDILDPACRDQYRTMAGGMIVG